MPALGKMPGPVCAGRPDTAGSDGGAVRGRSSVILGCGWKMGKALAAKSSASATGLRRKRRSSGCAAIRSSYRLTGW